MTEVVVFAPLLGALIAGFFHRSTGETVSQFVAIGSVSLSCFLSWVLFFSIGDQVSHLVVMPWIDSGSLSVDWSIRFDRLTAVMFVVITTISTLVHIYSIEYMRDDINWNINESYKSRFFAYLSFFTFTMLVLVSSENLVQLFFGWEGVGLASYLLVGFYYKKETANSAAMKAFVVNRVGDLGLALGIFAIFAYTDSLRLTEIFGRVDNLSNTSVTFLLWEFTAIELICALLFVGAMGKSAQLFLHTWLPDAMEGPTPVSALIHAATMVTAGVFLVTRMSPLFEYAPHTLAIIGVIGSLTAFFAATVALVQNDIKRIIAYSTCSQLGFMFVACAVGAYQAAMFHLFTHAFFKALLFLCAGSVIRSMHHEQDIRLFGGLRSRIPGTYWSMIVGTLAITGVGIPLVSVDGVPLGFAGFLSKDVIIESSFAVDSKVGFFCFGLLVVSAFMTSFYSWRLIFLTFEGHARGDVHIHAGAHESPAAMLVPLYILAGGAVLVGMMSYGVFVGDHWHSFWGSSIFQAKWNETLHHSHYVPIWVKISPFFAMIFGLGLAFLFFIVSPSLPARLSRSQNALHIFLLNKWYFDEIYDLLVIRTSVWIGRLFWIKGDVKFIDGLIDSLAFRTVPFFVRFFVRLQTGYVFHYAFAIVIGLVAILTWFVVAGGAR